MLVLIAAGLYLHQSLATAHAAHLDAVRFESALSDALEIREGLVRKGALQNEFAVTGDPAKLEEFEQASATSLELMRSLDESFPDNSTIDRAAGLIAASEAILNSIVVKELAPAMERESDQLVRASLDRADVELERLATVIEEVIEVLRSDFEAAGEEVGNELTSAERNIFVVIGIVLAFVAGLGVLVWPIISQLPRITAAASRIASGHPEVDELPVRSNDELGALASSFNEMTHVLNRVGQQAQASAPASCLRRFWTWSCRASSAPPSTRWWSPSG